jgi:phage-Barnase-EndoU-ColicinE5/D-RelE like nuclease2/Phage Mu protein F like protein
MATLPTNAAVNPAQLPFQEAIDFFRKKIQLPTSGWTDIWQQQHSLAFVVAGAQKDALVSDFYNAIKKAKESGTGYAEFRKDFDATVAKHGWAHNGTAGWRSKVIYDTNMTQAHNAGQWQQMWALRGVRPYVKYRHTSFEHPRLEHKAWDGLVIAIDDPWLNTHSPQNGWGCKCRLDSLTRTEAKSDWQSRGKSGPDNAPPIEWEEKTVGKLGSNPRTVSVPKGIDAGFAYNPGKAYLDPHTVPPLTGYDAVLKERGTPWPTGFKVPALPKPTAVDASFARSTFATPTDAVVDFLSVFGANLEQSSTFVDATGSALVVSKALFIKGNDKSTNNFKWLAEKHEGKTDRLSNVNLMAMALADPDEIWWHWERSRATGDWLLKRRYLKLFEISGTTEYAVTAYEWQRNGWIGSTTFIVNRGSIDADLKYFDNQRVGRLVYKKK